MKKWVVAVFILIISASAAYSQGKTIGIHAGAGTDITLGLAVGGGASYLLTDLVGFDMEVGAFLFYSYSVDSYTEYGNHYTETTSMFIFAVLSNFLFNYQGAEPGIFFIAGAGAAAMSVDWQIQSPDDSSANFTWDGVTGGLLVNIGLGGTFGGGFELRLQAPIFIVFTDYGGVKFAPMLVLLAGYRF